MTTARLQTCPLPSTAAIPRRRILVIDDEEFDQKIYSRIIQRSGLFDFRTSLEDIEAFPEIVQRSQHIGQP